MKHKSKGVQRNMLEKMGRSFVLALQSPLEEANRYDIFYLENITMTHKITL